MRMMSYMENILKEIKIAYSPYSQDLKGPGDRRRFCFFAKEMGIPYEILKRNANYDLVILSSISDLEQIDKLKKTDTKIIIDLVDSYLIKPTWIKDYLRNFGRNLKHKNYFNMLLPRKYTDNLKHYISKADAIICSTSSQKKAIEIYNSNVHIILDNMDDDVLSLPHYKFNNIKNKKQLNLLWEGLPSNLMNFKEISSVLNELSSDIEINLHIITDLINYKYLSKYKKLYTSDIVNSLSLNINTYIYEWNSIALSNIASICDLAIIPIYQKNKFVLGKPENKLILLWKLGIPVITSFTEAYSKTMKEAGLKMCCMNIEDWKESILLFYHMDENKKEEISKKVRDFANENYTKENLIKKWNILFNSVIG